jgi:NDP-sugar pyrophosphorylase family protein
VELAAILLVGGAPSPSKRVEPEAPGSVGLPPAIPLALQPLLGTPVIHHMASLLRSQGVGKIVALSEIETPPLASQALAEQKALNWQQVEEGQIWRRAENSFVELAQGVDEILVLHMGGYLLLDVQDLLAHHYEHRCRITPAISPDGQPLPVYVISANRRNDAACLFRSGLEQMRTPCTSYVCRGYHNRLQTAADFRKLTIDALLQKIPIQPQGKEVRPGVWLAPGAMVHSSARLVPPVYIGEHARVMPGALVTRCAVMEHHALLSPGGVVENATLLPYTRLGEKLELRNSVACGNWVEHLRHRVAMEVGDPRLLSSVPQRAPSRVSRFVSGVASACSLVSMRRLVAKISGTAGSDASDGFQAPSAHAEQGRREEEQNGFAGDVAVARRYGNQ